MFKLDFLYSKDLDIIKYYSLFFSVFKINLFSACSVFIAGGMLIAQQVTCSEEEVLEKGQKTKLSITHFFSN